MKCKITNKKIEPFMSFGDMPIANGFIKKESAGTRTGITTTHTGMGEGVGVYVCVCGETASVTGADSTGMVQNIHSVGIFYYKIFSQ